MRKPVRYAELVLPMCSRTYGSAPCTAEIGVTGSYKCYNSPKTCQDPENFLGDDLQVIRWAAPTADLDVSIPADPRITSISRRPQMIEPGEGVGVRESVTVSFHNSRHNDSVFDRYIVDRGHNTYNKGTYWGKFAARWGSLQGMEFRLVDGFVGQSIGSMETRHYVVEATAGPDSNGNYSITAKDVIKLIDADKAQAPAPSAGKLSADIATGNLTFTIEPLGVGASYPAAGVASIGDECISFTRSGDDITITQRGLYNTKIADHSDGDTLQVGLVYDGEDIAYIINDLLENYTAVPSEYLDYSGWLAESLSYVGLVYTAQIMKPTPIKDLISELVTEAGLVFYTDLIAKKIVVRALRSMPPVASISDDNIIAGSASSKILDDRRVSQVWTFYGKRNPLEKRDKKENYASIYASATSSQEAALGVQPEAIREIFSRWIPQLSQPAAEALNSKIISRYDTAPRQVAARLPHDLGVLEGRTITVSSRIFEDAQGDPEPPFLAQIVQLERIDHGYNILAEEVRYSPVEAGTVRTITFSDNAYSVNLRAVHDSIYSAADDSSEIVVNILAGVWIGSLSQNTPSLTVGDWPAGASITINLLGEDSRIEGRGGNGAYSAVFPAEKGSIALYTRRAVTLSGNGKIYGGGGGGGAFVAGWKVTGGAGGAGVPAGVPDGTEDFGGCGYYDYKPCGGDPGEPGESSTTAGGAGGAAIDGASYVTITDSPSILGATIN